MSLNKVVRLIKNQEVKGVNNVTIKQDIKINNMSMWFVDSENFIIIEKFGKSYRALLSTFNGALVVE